MNLLAQVIIRRGLAFVPFITYPHGADWNLLSLAVRPMPHDAGTYYTVVAFYENPAAEAYALRVEREFPGRWDAEARHELGLEG